MKAMILLVVARWWLLGAAYVVFGLGCSRLALTLLRTMATPSCSLGGKSLVRQCAGVSVVLVRMTFRTRRVDCVAAEMCRLLALGSSLGLNFILRLCA